MKYYIGIDLGGTVIKVGLVCEGKVVASTRIDADSQHGLAARLPVIGESIDALMSSEGVSAGSLAGIGMAFPGIVDFRNRRAASTNAKYDDAPVPPLHNPRTIPSVARTYQSDFAEASLLPSQNLLPTAPLSQESPLHGYTVS